ncbi:MULTISPECIES: hypothetical protein [unclassified Cryobacterium]|nr:MULTISPECIES: hypothetical protein [unclassified Cryobacterium]MDY7527252.1 hypothetical protein [Cryobacterium sp. 10C2]MEB0002965.1 hypothetical protein [Cryobacterium sp. RTC2.1]MEB0201324.1 hypothetical protein [Cryobacterium sp. 5I3]MEB0285879.1 hypothetical protein [Cryobacterium sp. 10S3]MEB0290284.1 hypothetical protein [Cryobacterium sp. 10C2]
MGARSSGRARARDVLAAVAVWVPLAAVVTTWLIWREELPTDLPRQWGSHGVSSTWPTWMAIALLVVVCLASALIATFALREGAAPTRRKTFLWSGFAAGLATGGWLMIAGSTITSGPGAEPQVGAWPLLLMALLGYGLIPFLLAHRWVAAEPEHHPVEVVLGPTEIGAWITTVTVPLFAIVSLALFAAAAALLILTTREGEPGADVFGAVVLLLLAVLMLGFARLRISVDWRGLKVVTWFLGIALKTIPLTDIESVHTNTLEPMHWGGWGYRFMPGRSAIILRTGPGVVVTLTNGKQFALSLNEPETPAALLSTLSTSAK